MQGNVDSISVTSRVKAIDMVAALMYMEEQRIVPRSRSEIVSLCVQAVANLIDEDKKPSLQKALEILDGKYPVQTRKGLKLVTTQTGAGRRKLIEASEKGWHNVGTQNSQVRQTSVSIQGGPRPEMRQRDGVMYIIHPTFEGYQRDCVMYRKMIEDGRAKVVMKEEWDAIDRPPNLAPPQDWLDKAVVGSENPTEGCKQYSGQGNSGKG